MTLLLVLIGGALGAAGRSAVDWYTSVRWSNLLPWGTLLVNICGAFLLGLLGGAGSRLPGWLGTLAGTGFCGALTTYSTFSYQVLQLGSGGPARLRRAVLYVGTTLSVGLGAAALGWLLGAAL